MIKKILLIVSLCASVFAAQIEWAPSYKVAVEKAKKENKLILLMLTQPGCPACLDMKKIMSGDDLIVNEINTKFVPVEVNVYEGQWNQKFRAIATPTFYFLDSNENKTTKFLSGGTSGSVFFKILKDAQQKR